MRVSKTSLNHLKLCCIVEEVFEVAEKLCSLGGGAFSLVHSVLKTEKSQDPTV